MANDLVVRNGIIIYPSSLESLTYAQALTKVNNSTLLAGTHYKITDKADLGIILLAVSTNKFSLEGQGIFLNPDFQDIGNYSNTPQTKGTNRGVWSDASESGYVVGDICFWDGLHFQLTSETVLGFGDNPIANTTDYTALTKVTSNVGYIEEIDFIKYDFSNDYIIQRIDKRGNNIIDSIGSDYLYYFQWGNDSVHSNVSMSESGLDILNQKGQVTRNLTTNSCYVIASEINIGAISENRFGGTSQYRCDFTSGGLQGCILEGDINIIFASENYNGKELTRKYSTFPTNLDMSDGVIYNAGTLTIPTNLNYIGEFKLINNTGVTVSYIINSPTNHDFAFYADFGLSYLFDHTSIVSSSINELVSDTATVKTIVGRTNKYDSDFLLYARKGFFNLKINEVILA